MIDKIRKVATAISFKIALRVITIIAVVTFVAALFDLNELLLDPYEHLELDELIWGLLCGVLYMAYVSHLRRNKLKKVIYNLKVLTTAFEENNVELLSSYNELSQPLMAVSGFIDLCIRELKDTDEVESLVKLNKAKTSISRIEGIVIHARKQNLDSYKIYKKNLKLEAHND